MTYYKQFAEMLGLELGQEFNIVSADGEKISSLLYRIEDDGVYSAVSPNAALWGREQSTIVDRLLGGVLVPVPNPWKPKVCGNYWRYSIGLGRAYKDTWFGSLHDLAYWKIGNCFKTEEEANTKGKEIIEQIKKEYEEE